MKRSFLFLLTICLTCRAAGQESEFTFSRSLQQYPLRTDHVQDYFYQDAFNDFIHWQMKTLYIPGFQAGIMHEGKLVWMNNYGYSNLEQQIPVNDSTLFIIASMSKPVTGAAMMKTIEDGKMDLHEDINQYLPFQIHNPWYPSPPITPEMIMTHTSSIHDAGGIWYYPYFTYGKDSIASLGTLVYDALDTNGAIYSPNTFYNNPPGAYGSYTNLGVALGGYLVESAWQKPFNIFCNDSLFTPLEMPSTRWMFSEVDTLQLSFEYPCVPGNLPSFGHSKYSDYPCDGLKTNVAELSHFLSMYMNHGQFKGKRILDPATVDLITTVHDTISIWGFYPWYYGYLWNYGDYYDIWNHGGHLPGCITWMFYNKPGNWGGLYFSNSDPNHDNLDFFIVNAAKRFSPLTVASIKLTDQNQNGIPENGETVELVTGLMNNLMDPASSVQATISCNDPDFTILDSMATFGNLAPGAILNNQGQPFRFRVSNNTVPHEVAVDMKIQYNNRSDTIQFPVYIGHADVLLVKDGKEFLGSENYYLDALDHLGYKVQYWDTRANGLPDSSLLLHYPAVVWYTGYDFGEALDGNSLAALSNYLDHGGNLLMTGQNICDRQINDSFLHDYMHVTLADTNAMPRLVWGISGDTIGDGLILVISGGDGMNDQYSPGKVDPVDGGTACFKYPADSHAAGVHFMGSYKSVFLSFGFEAISNQDARNLLMERIFGYFGVNPGIREHPGIPQEIANFSLMPNPARDHLDIRFELKNGQEVSVSLFDNLGKEWHKSPPVLLQPGIQAFRINTSGLPAGSYIVRLQGRNNIKSLQAIIVK